MEQTIQIPVWMALVWPLVWALLALLDGWRARMWLKFAKQMGFPARSDEEA